MKKKLLSILILFTCTSCTLFQKKESLHFFDPNLDLNTTEDYLKTWETISRDFHQSHVHEIIVPDSSSRIYFEKLIAEISMKNELITNHNLTLKIFFIRHDRPFYFSLPTGEIFLSTKLIQKYLDNEGFLVALLTFEMLRMKWSLYRKEIFLPKGYIPLEKIISLVLLTSEERIKLHQWSYYAIARTQFNPEQYLSFIQLQNRNHQDFSFLFADTSLLIKEESQLKQFVVNNYGKSSIDPLKSKSSKDFYNFTARYRR